MEYVQHANGVVIYLHTNSQVFSPPLLRTLARGSVHSVLQFPRSSLDTVYKF